MDIIGTSQDEGEIKMLLNQAGQRATIGFFTHGIDFNIGYERYAGAAQKALELDYNLICVMHEPRNEKGSVGEPELNNLFYQLLSGQLNGLIYGMSPSNVMSSSALTQLLNYYQMPKIIFSPLENIPQIRFNDYQGMREVILHLIERHGLKRIFFIRGPETHFVSGERYRAYQELMNQYGYFDRQLVSQPVTWNPKQEALTVEQLLGGMQPGRDIEAIVAINDMWALECIETLQEKGIRIPDDLAVTGVNDSFQGKNSTVSLTTIAYPFYEQGFQAVQQLSEAFQGKTISDRFLDIKLITRCSCGCCDPELTRITEISSHNTITVSSFGQPIDHRQLAEQLARCFESNISVPPDCLMERIELLIQEFVLGLKQQNAHKFLTLLTNLIKTDSADSNEHWEGWQNVLGLFWQKIFPSLEPGQQVAAGILFQQAMVVLNSIKWRTVGYQIIKKKDQTRLVNQLQAEMNRIFNRYEMASLLAEYLPKIGFTSCYLVLYEEPQPYIFPQDFPEFSRLIMGFNRNGRIHANAGGEGVVFATRQLLPEEVQSDLRFTMFASPLFYRENQFGYLLAELTPPAFSFYKVLCNQIECCLWGTYLFQRQKKVEESLARSNKELEHFAYIASHDLQEPLRKIIAFGDRLRQSYAKGLIAQGDDYLKRVQSAAARMQVLINDLLTYSRVTTKAKPFSKVNLYSLLFDVLADLEVKVSQTKAQVVVESLPTIMADPLQMRQLFQNLLGNSLKFSRPGIAPLITVYSAVENGEVVEIVVEDNGIGIEAADYERIFGVFERLHGRGEYEGSGVGLAICKKIVERHQGTIKIESALGAGSKFKITLPCIR
jgi:signal transduction histidine kinase/DNA-binding LacI/PurR family transcriptional regulator